MNQVEIFTVLNIISCNFLAINQRYIQRFQQVEFFHDLSMLVPDKTRWHVRLKVLRRFCVYLAPPHIMLGLILANEELYLSMNTYFVN